MNTVINRTCGNCKSAAHANVKGMEGMLWCQAGHAAAQSGVRSVEAVFINPQRAGCDKHGLRTGPIPEANAPEESVAADTSSEESPVDTPTSVEPTAASQKAPHGKDEPFPSGYFL